jgi:hypothetical protein
MLTKIEGVYRHGKVELKERPEHALEDTPVIVTFLPTGAVDLRKHGIDAPQAAELRDRLATFAQDWDSPEMAVYDHYDAHKALRHTLNL